MGSPEESAEFQSVQSAEETDEIPQWMQKLEEEKAPEPNAALPTSEFAPDAAEMQAEQPAQLDDMPEWMQYIEDKETAEVESTAVTGEQATTADVSEWMGSIEQPGASVA